MPKKRNLLLLVSESGGGIFPFRWEGLDKGLCKQMTLECIVEVSLRTMPVTSNRISDYDFFSWDIKWLDPSLRVNRVPFPGIVIVMYKRDGSHSSKLLASMAKIGALAFENIKDLIDQQIEYERKKPQWIRELGELFLALLEGIPYVGPFSKRLILYLKKLIT